MFKELIQKYFPSKFSKDTIWLIFAQLVLMVSGLSINLLIALKEGSAVLGVFNQALAYYTILATLFALGLNNSLIKKISEATKSVKQERELLTSNILFTFLISSLFSFIAIVLVMNFKNLLSSPDLAEVIHIPMFALPFFNVNKNIMAYHSGKRNQRKFAMERIIRWGGLLLLIATFSFLEFSLATILYSFLITETFLLIVNCISLWSHFDFAFKWLHVRENLAFGTKSYISEIISVLSATFDIVIIGYFLSNTDIGIYSFIIFFVKTLYIFPGILMQNINPIISNLWSTNNITNLKKYLISIKKINAWVISIQAILLLVIYKIVIVFVKYEFALTYRYFLISLVGIFIFSSISWSGSILVMTGKLKENNWRTSIIIAINILSTTFFASQFGLTGACVAASVNGVVAFLLTKGFILKVLNFKAV